MKLHPRDRPAAMARHAVEGKILELKYHYEELAIALLGIEVAGVGPDEKFDPEMIADIRARFLAGCEEQGMTFGERLMCAGSILQGNAKYVIRWERHGNFDTPGGLE